MGGGAHFCPQPKNPGDATDLDVLWVFLLTNTETRLMMGGPNVVLATRKNPVNLEILQTYSNIYRTVTLVCTWNLQKIRYI